MVENLNAASQQETYFTAKRYSDVVVTIRNNEVKIFLKNNWQELTDFNLIYLYGITHPPLRHVIAACAKHYGVKVVNSEADRFQCMTKIEQNVVLALNDVPVPNSLYTTHLENVTEELLSKIGFKFPMVAKAIDGKNGRNNEKISTLSELFNLDFDDLIIQPFISNDFDYRAIVAGDEVVHNFKRIRSSDDHHQNNIALGGEAEICDLPTDLNALAVAAAKTVGRELTALDILINKETGQPVILEVNFNLGRPVLDSRVTVYHEKIAKYLSSLLGERVVDNE
jgi:glutathione synthase/RimK-type ligase-like ATP-grasp enzyme